MNNTMVKRLILTLLSIFIFINFSYANTYSNNSIEIEVSPIRRSYDYGDNVGIDINITNKNRYAKLYYRILEVYSGGDIYTLVKVNNLSRQSNALFYQ